MAIISATITLTTTSSLPIASSVTSISTRILTSAAASLSIARIGSVAIAVVGLTLVGSCGLLIVGPASRHRVGVRVSIGRVGVIIVISVATTGMMTVVTARSLRLMRYTCRTVVVSVSPNRILLFDDEDNNGH